jgi:hypothetical protein
MRVSAQSSQLPSLAPLESIVRSLDEAKAVVDRIRADRDRLILELALNGVPRKKIAEACGTAEVSIYKILEKQRAGL